MFAFPAAESPFVPLTPHRSGTDGPDPVHPRAPEQALA